LNAGLGLTRDTLGRMREPAILEPWQGSMVGEPDHAILPPLMELRTNLVGVIQSADGNRDESEPNVR
jgi:hypothetical protein